MRKEKSPTMSLCTSNCRTTGPNSHGPFRVSFLEWRRFLASDGRWAQPKSCAVPSPTIPLSFTYSPAGLLVYTFGWALFGKLSTECWRLRACNWLFHEVPHFVAVAHPLFSLLNRLATYQNHGRVLMIGAVSRMLCHCGTKCLKPV